MSARYIVTQWSDYIMGPDSVHPSIEAVKAHVDSLVAEWRPGDRYTAITVFCPTAGRIVDRFDLAEFWAQTHPRPVEVAS